MGNWHMNISIIFELIILCILVYTPYLNEYLILTSVRPEIFIAPLPFMALMIFYDEIRRWAVRSFPAGSWVQSEFYT